MLMQPDRIDDGPRRDNTFARSSASAAAMPVRR